MNLPPRKKPSSPTNHPFQPPSPTLHEQSSSPYLATKRARVRVINHRRWKREGRAKMAVDTRRIAETAEARCIPDWPIRPWPSQGSSASSASFLLQEASPSCGELSKPRSFPSHPFPSLHRACAQLRRAIARIEQPSSLVFLPALPRVSCRGGW